MQSVYPDGPAAVPADLTRPTAAYKNRAWLAMAGLGLFVLLYFALAGWFTWTAWHLLSGALKGGDVFWPAAAGVAAAFLAVFMWKALIFVQHRYQIDDIEITAQQQPKLFAFLHRLADEAGAPRAHRVFLSPRVNAAVSYDLSILNLLLPSKKNLEIGLALVNSLTLGEMKAVLAHEFGHFAQRSMAVGRWVYIAQQIAGHIISRRDALDRFLRALSRVDIRIAWVGWLLSLIIWSIRSLMETVFRLVVLAQRALSREMELQADLVAVSITGSDALVHALHKLHVADEAWERTMSFAASEAHAGRAVKDLFEVQRQITQKLRLILDQPQYGEVAPLPSERPHEHRVFKAQLAQAPRMWSTHPANTEREQNAKRTYIPAPIDERSAWLLFSDVEALKQQMSAHVFRAAKTEPAELAESLKRLDEQYDRAYLNRSYRGAYLWRALARHVSESSELYNPPLKQELVNAELASLYPESLADNLARLRELEDEKAQLQALRDGFPTAPGGVIRHRGKELRRKDLPEALEDVQDELNAARDLVIAHDRRCRTAHLAAAAGLGSGWSEYLQGLAKVLHYAEHAEANLRDAQGVMSNVIAVVTADGRVSKSELKRLIGACVDVHSALRHVYEDEGKLVVLDRTLSRRLSIESWQLHLGELKLPLPDEQNINQWLGVIDDWVGLTAAKLSSLRLAALEQLLLAESNVARFVRDSMAPAAAPEPTRVPSGYPVLLPGGERPRQKKLDLWDRFHTADGLVPTLARLAAACGIVAAVVSVGGAVGQATINIYNGLGRPVTVDMGTYSTHVSAFSHATLDVPREAHYTVRARTNDNQQIESFDVDLQNVYEHYVYNVAGASPLVQWTAVYGGNQRPAERLLGTPRWATSNASYIFEEPPKTISSRSGGDTREVLSALAAETPGAVLSAVKSDKERADVIAAHARWDASNSIYVAHWLDMAAGMPGFQSLLGSRLAETPADVLLLRVEQDAAAPQERAAVCERHRARAQSSGANIDLQYIAARCLGDGKQRDAAFLDLYRKDPQNGWVAQAVGYTFAEHQQWAEALPAMELARAKLPAMAGALSLDMARVRRVLGGASLAGIDQRASEAEALRYYASLETAGQQQPGIDRAYQYLGHGDMDRAIAEAANAPGGNFRLIRLAAASDGASEALVRQALALTPEQGLDGDTVWTALALAMRERADTSPYVRTLNQDDPERARAMTQFLDSLQAGVAPAAAEQTLGDLHLKLRGHAYSAASVLLGARAPRRWRDQANQLLFVPERPHFSTVADKPSDGRDRPRPLAPERPDDGVVRTQPRLI